jgi:hypothetical protein
VAVVSKDLTVQFKANGFVLVVSEINLNPKESG